MLVELYSWYPPIGSMCTTLSMLLHAPTVHTLLLKHWLWCKTKEDFFFFPAFAYIGQHASVMLPVLS